jgi:Rad3-related DNA helicase
MGRTRIAPSALGFDSKRYPSYRPRQLETALDIASSDKRFSFLDAPPGSGKSVLNLTIAKVRGARTLVLTSTKALQTQYVEGFKSLNLCDARGQQNYRCLALDKGGVLEHFGSAGSSCAEGPCRVGVHCPLRQSGCLYYDQIAEAREDDVVVTSYAMWLTLARHTDPTLLGDFGLIVMDEAHAAPNSLTDFCAVELDRAEIRELLGLDLPPVDEGIDVWAAWAKDASSKARLMKASMSASLKTLGSDRHKLTKKLLRLTTIERDLVEMSKARSWKRTDAAGSRRGVGLDRLRDCEGSEVLTCMGQSIR